MTTAQALPAVALDETANGFISTFMAHVATLAGYGKNRLTTIATIKTLLLAALKRGDATDWRTLYHAVDELVDGAIYAHDTKFAYTYLCSFIQENVDLA
jgi:hypothetical protein